MSVSAPTLGELVFVLRRLDVLRGVARFPVDYDWKDTRELAVRVLLMPGELARAEHCWRTALGPWVESFGYGAP